MEGSEQDSALKSRRSSRRRSLENVRSPSRGSLKFDYTPSGNEICVDPTQVAFKSSSLALLRAKRNKNGKNGRADDSYLNGAQKVVNFMNSMYRCSKLCDVLLRCRGKDIFAHKIALGAYSNELAEKFADYPPGEVISIEMYDFPAQAVELVLGFIYTTDITINDSNIETILGCAQELGVTILIELCMDRLRNYNVKNAIRYIFIAEKFELEEIKQGLLTFICENFAEITQTPEFLSLPCEVLVALLSRDSLIVPSELAVFFAIVDWIDHNKQERLSLAPTLLRTVRFALIPPEALATQVEVVSHIFDMRPCFNMLYDSMKYHALRYSGSRLADSYSDAQPRGGSTALGFPSPPPTPFCENSAEDNPGFSIANMKQEPNQEPSPVQIKRSPSDKSVSCPGRTFTMRRGSNPLLQCPMLSVGGMDMQNLDPNIPGKCVYRMDPVTGHWAPLTSMVDNTHHHGAVIVDGFLYVVGGAIYDSSTPEELGTATNAVHRLDIAATRWTRLAPMRQRRAYFGLVEHQGTLYAVGGENEDKIPIDTIERYDIPSDTWSYVSRLPNGGRIGVATAVHRGSLYIIGGYRKYKTSNPVLDFVECYDFEQDCWLAKRSLQTPLCHAGMVEAGGRLLLVGGRTKVSEPRPAIKSLPDVLVYDDVTDDWHLFTRLRLPRHDFGIAVTGHELYIIGGLKSPSPFCLASVECIDLETGHHIDEKENMPFPVAGVTCCVNDRL